MKGFVYSRQGEERNVNEDSALLKIYEQKNLISFAVADGMGDLDFGDEVSRIAVVSAIQYIEKHFYVVDWSKALKEALEYADSEIKNFCIENRCVSGVAIAIGVICNNVLTFSWQGNVRIYCGCSDRWLLLTEDHKIFVGKDGYRLSRCLMGHGLRDDINIISME
ncbi:MAG: protein phosphatase 2C domain-containing protein, partial [Allobaculum sp.]|nr:protein phosphatase 2C domain-containing protein [Allobaculum sp.]